MVEWLEELYRCDDVDEGLDLIFDRVDSMLDAERYDELDAVLDAIDVTRLCAAHIIGFLATTVSVECSPARVRYWSRADAELGSRGRDGLAERFQV